MKEQFTSLEIIEFLFGPVFPGADLPSTTISIFKKNGSSEAHFGRLGILKDAIGYVHSTMPIDTSMIRGTITGISNNFNKVGPWNQRAQRDIESNQRDAGSHKLWSGAW